MSTMINLTQQNCFDCINRSAKFCNDLDDELTLEKVEDNILVFKEQNNCVAYCNRRNLTVNEKL